MPQSPKPDPAKYKTCMDACQADTVGNFILGAAGALDPSAVMGMVSVAVDVFGGGINPIGSAFGTSSYFTYGDTGWQSPGATSMVGAGVSGIAAESAYPTGINRGIRQATKSNFSRSALTALFGRGGGNTLGGTFGKAIPVVGLYFAGKGASDFKKNCEKRCEQYL